LNRLLRSALATALILTGCGKAAPSAKGLAHTPKNPGVNIYAHAGAGDLSPVAAKARHLVYVPNSRSATLSVIDPATYQVIATLATGKLPQHVVPSHDLKTLYVANDIGNSLTPIDPESGAESRPIPVDDPYNLYFTPDGRFAMVVAERLKRIDFRDAATMKLVQSVHLNCKGVDHVEFTSDNRFAIATCEFSGQLVKIDLATRAVVGYLDLAPGVINSIKTKVARLIKGRRDPSMSASMPQDIRSSPDGAVFYVADMKKGGVFLIDPAALKILGFIKTGPGTHGLYPSRDGSRLYITNRGWSSLRGGPHAHGSVSVLDFASNKIVANWTIPGGGSPDMGNVTVDGNQLWVSGRYDNEVYVFDTRTGELIHRIPVQREPHGLCVWPQPGRYSLGHTGNMR
jgi:YVTN family beta-propeller protein